LQLAGHWVLEDVVGMPSITAIKEIGHGVFISKSYKLPDSDWKQPSGNPNSGHYANDCFDLMESIAIPKMIPAWFTPRNMNKYHQAACDDRGKDYKEVHDACIDAVKFSHDMWKLQAKIKDLKVNAVTALGTPGCLDGPELESNIKNAPMVASWTGNKAKYRDAVAAGVSKCFKEWQSKVTVPGLPWYPAFAAFPGPMAPPMPNVPVPLIACVSAKVTAIAMPDDMKKEMISAFDGGLKKKDKDKFHEGLFEAIATALSVAFVSWMPQQQPMLVMGKGPIPTFAPPYVPVGPVVMGDNIGAPGHALA
jgi:hypothetical protein